MEKENGLSNLMSEISVLIEQSRQYINIQANSTLTQLFWNIGRLINAEILKKKQADYGKQILSTLSTKLKIQYGRNFEERNLRRMIQFSEKFTDYQIIAKFSQKLSWSHFVELLPLKKEEARNFYAQLSISESLGIRALRTKISTKVFERTEIANIQISSNQSIPINTFKDPYILDFLNLKNTYLEQDLEQAILRELETFILELGKGFAFMERQKRMIIDDEDFYLDLLFYNRNLKRLVAIELKLGKFEAAHKGQMELYLKWLNRHEKQEGEKEPIGLIMCAESNKEQIELLELHKDGIMVAEYWTEMPTKAEMAAKLHQMLIEAKERIARNSLK